MSRIRAWWQGLSSLLRLRIMALGALALFAVIPSCLALLAGQSWAGLALNFGTEMAGAFVTFIVIDQLVGRYEKHEETVLEQESLKAGLIAQLGSQLNDVAIAAAEELRRHGWLIDGSLQGALLRAASLREAPLWSADLAEASFFNANLQRARLFDANLQKAVFWNANLQGALLWNAKLQGADLGGANLKEADLEKAALQGARLEGTDLQSANLADANLADCNLWLAEFNEETLLPDSTHWTSDTDMARFTDPDHPNFWRSDAPYPDNPFQEIGNG
jgi:hypothetical protein